MQTLIYYAYQLIIFQLLQMNLKEKEISLNNNRFLKLLNKTRISISNDDTRHYLNGIFLHFTEAHGRNFFNWCCN